MGLQMPIVRPNEYAASWMQLALPIEHVDDRKVRQAQASHRLIRKRIQPPQQHIAVGKWRWGPRRISVNCLANPLCEPGSGSAAQTTIADVRNVVACLENRSKRQKQGHPLIELPAQLLKSRYSIRIAAWDIKDVA
jgi:hypothetical protein